MDQAEKRNVLKRKMAALEDELARLDQAESLMIIELTSSSHLARRLCCHGRGCGCATICGSSGRARCFRRENPLRKRKPQAASL